MTRLFLVRHGETTDLDTEPLYKGSLDIPLSETGVRTMRETAAYLLRFPISCVYTSSLSRAVESGRLIAEPRGLAVAATNDLNEVHFGLWQGLTFRQINETYPEAFRLWWEDPVRHTPPGGEPLEAARERILRQYSHVVEKHRDQDIVLATHAGTIRLILCSVLGIGMKQIFRIRQDNGCVNVVDVYDDGITVVSLLNYTPSGSFGRSSAGHKA